MKQQTQTARIPPWIPGLFHAPGAGIAVVWGEEPTRRCLTCGLKINFICKSWSCKCARTNPHIGYTDVPQGVALTHHEKKLPRSRWIAYSHICPECGVDVANLGRTHCKQCGVKMMYLPERKTIGVVWGEQKL